MQSKTTKVGELNIHYYSGGQGRPLIVVHGGGIGAKSWIEPVRELLKHYRVYVPDLPGFGKSQSLKEEFHITEVAAFINNFADSLGINNFDIVGHSIGGGIALNYAFKFPERVRKLVLVSSFCLGNEVALWIRLATLQIFTPLAKFVHSAFKAIGWVIRSLRIPFEFNNPLPRVKLEIGRRLTTLKGQNGVLFDRLAELTMPTLLVWGSKDGIVPVSQAYAAAKVIPDCYIHVCEGVGHGLYRHENSEFSQLLMGFLK